MDLQPVVDQLTDEINRLTTARDHLLEIGRLTNHAYKTAKPAYAKRTMSAAGRARIAEAQRARWRKQKRLARMR